MTDPIQTAVAADAAKVETAVKQDVATAEAAVSTETGKLKTLFDRYRPDLIAFLIGVALGVAILAARHAVHH